MCTSAYRRTLGRARMEDRSTVCHCLPSSLSISIGPALQLGTNAFTKPLEHFQWHKNQVDKRGELFGLSSAGFGGSFKITFITVALKLYKR